jgi:hypothetical protein
MRHRVAVFIARWRTEYSVATLLLYIVVLYPVSIVLFPDNSLWLVLVILTVGFLDEVKDLADQLADESEDR